MEKMTITEALSEINLIAKKVEKKKEMVLQNVVKPKHVKDKIETEGGSRAFVISEVQSINDLIKRHVSIRGAVAKANIENSITISGKTDTIHNWLTYRRDFAQKQIDFKTNIHRTVKNEVDKIVKQPQVYKDDAGMTHLLEIESNVDFAAFMKSAEEEQEVFDRLDGQLSLKNATIIVTI